MRLLLLLVILCASARACLWDSDTLAAEAKGLPGTLEIITGRFERNPHLFYEMRLERVTKEIKKQPGQLELYDDAGVACDRLHKGDESIAWMTKKRAQLKPFPQDKEHWYRYHANLGTFQAHRWLRSGANRKNIGEMKTARDNIKRAIQINPDAHFGREKYQLMAMEWIIDPPKHDFSNYPPDFLRLGEVVVTTAMMDGWPKTQKESVRGLTGLIVLGNAWESIDVFYALKKALVKDVESSLALMASYRIAELTEEGKKSLWPHATDKDLALMAATSHSFILEPRFNSHYLPRYYEALREEAETYQANRTAYMMERLQLGRHPDTDKNFWSEWRETSPPGPEIMNSVWFQKPWLKPTLLLFCFTGVCCLVLVIHKRTKGHQST